jgi:hypothetical protein
MTYGGSVREKHQNPTSSIQRSFKHQIRQNLNVSLWLLELGISLDVGARGLELYSSSVCRKSKPRR